MLAFAHFYYRHAQYGMPRLFAFYMLASVQPLHKLPPNLPAGIHRVRLPDRMILVLLRACVAGFHFSSINHYTTGEPR
jgi:hypothetical protein